MAFKESEIQKMMKSLDLTREEAIQLLQDDADDVTAELTPEQEKVAASNRKIIERTEEEAAEIRKAEVKRNNFLDAHQYADEIFAMQQSKAAMEPVLMPFFKQSPKLKTTYEDFRKAQEQWIKAKFKKEKAEAKRRQMMLCEKEFMDEYRAVMLPVLKERYKSLQKEINWKRPANFIECMEKSFSIPRMLFIFGRKASKYTGEDEIPEEYAEEAKKMKQEDNEEE